MQWSIGLLFSLLLVRLPCLECGRSKSIDYDALEKAWRTGDDERELRTEGDEQYRQLADKDEEEAKALGPQMIFVTLKDEDNRGSLPDIASQWKEMLWNGGVEVNIYEVADSKLLVGLQKGIFVSDVMKFLDEQPSMKEYEWKGEAYSAGSAATRRKRHKKRGGKSRRQKALHAGKGSKPGKISHTNRKAHRKNNQASITPRDKTSDKRQRHGMNDEL